MTAAQGFLTTHVLDTARGVPASDLRIELFRIDGDERTKLADLVTNGDGRTDTPILPKSTFSTGLFELVFHAGNYLAKHGLGGDSPRFLDVIPIRFGINDASSHYHVPLLLSPFGYSTYRGS